MSDRYDLSDEDQDIDIESDEDDTSSSLGGNQFATEAEKKAHHNMLERKRRDHIKASFHNLRDVIPVIRKEKVKPSRAQILKSATDYIQLMTKKNSSILKDIDSMKKSNTFLRQQVAVAEKSRTGGLPSELMFDTYGEEERDSSDSSEPAVTVGRRQRKKPRAVRQ